MQRLNQEHRAIIRELALTGDTRVGLAIRTRIPVKRVGTALRGLLRSGYIHLNSNRNYTLTPKGVELAEALKRRPE